jgi:hypothetical protein
MNNIIAYIVYLTVTVITTVFVGKHLHKNGYHLIFDLFENERFTTTVNNLLLTGYYLVNIGYIAITIDAFHEISSLDLLFSRLAQRIGIIFLILGSLHYNNILILHLLSRRKQEIIKMFNN